MTRPPLFIHSSFDGHLNCFHFLTLTNNTAVTIHVQIYVCTLHSTRSGISLRSYHTSFQSNCTILQSLQTVYEGFHFSTSLSAFVTVFDHSHPSEYDEATVVLIYIF